MLTMDITSWVHEKVLTKKVAKNSNFFNIYMFYGVVFSDVLSTVVT